MGAKRPLTGVRNTNTKKYCSIRQNSQKKNFFCAVILHPLLFKVFKSKTTSFRYFSQGFRISKIFGHPTLGSGGKKTFKWYFKSGHTDRHTHIHIHKVKKAGFGADWGNSRPKFERIEICSAKYIFSPTRPTGPSWSSSRDVHVSVECPLPMRFFSRPLIGPQVT